MFFFEKTMQISSGIVATIPGDSAGDSEDTKTLSPLSPENGVEFIWHMPMVFRFLKNTRLKKKKLGQYGRG